MTPAERKAKLYADIDAAIKQYGRARLVEGEIYVPYTHAEKVRLSQSGSGETSGKAEPEKPPQ